MTERPNGSMQPLKNRRILVVGASSGIGRAVARSVANLGADVVAVGRRRQLLDTIIEELGAGTVVEADLRDPAQCESLVARALDAGGPIDALVFAASAASLALMSEADAETWRAVLETNVVAPALVTRALLPHLAPGAFLGYLSSEIVGQPYQGLTHYASSKAALEELVRGLRVEHPEHRFCCIRVGATDGTDFARDFSPELIAALIPQWNARAKLPATYLDADDVADAIAGLLTASFALPGIDLQDITIRSPGGPDIRVADSPR